MRILFVLWSGGIGGAEIHTARLAHALVQRGNWAGVLIISRPSAVEDMIEDSGVPHFGLALP